MPNCDVKIFERVTVSDIYQKIKRHEVHVRGYKVLIIHINMYDLRSYFWDEIRTYQKMLDVIQDRDSRLWVFLSSMVSWPGVQPAVASMQRTINLELKKEVECRAWNGRRVGYLPTHHLFISSLEKFCHFNYMKLILTDRGKQTLHRHLRNAFTYIKT